MQHSLSHVCLLDAGRDVFLWQHMVSILPIGTLQPGSHCVASCSVQYSAIAGCMCMSSACCAPLTDATLRLVLPLL